MNISNLNNREPYFQKMEDLILKFNNQINVDDLEQNINNNILQNINK